jgi:pimeloyl-ACP methyl ester carboxylesterase
LLIEQASRNYDPAPLYERVSIPVLLVMAVPANAKADDIREARNHVDEVARKLRQGTAISIDNSGHWIQRDEPEGLARAIEGFITKRR